MDIAEIYRLTIRERKVLFFNKANKCGLVKDGKYIDGIPSDESSEEDTNAFYLLEDWLDYPQPQVLKPYYLKRLNNI